MSIGSVVCWIIVSLGLLFVAISGILYYVGHRTRAQQNKVLYHPEVPPESREVCESPVELGIPNSEDISVLTADGFTLQGFLLWPDRPPLAEEVLRVTAAASAEAGKEPTTTAVAVGDGAEATPAVPNRILSSSKSSSRESNCVEHSLGGGGVNPSSTLGSAMAAAATTGEVSKGGRIPSFVLLYFHGNAGNVGHRLGLAEAFVQRLGCAVVMVDYRGYGLSSATTPTQQGLEMDAEACLDFLWNDPRIPKDRIYVMGTSLGGAVAIHLAAKLQCGKRIKALIIENTFTSISDMASSLGQPLFEQHGGKLHCLFFWLFNHYVKPLVLNVRWRSAQLIPTVHKPMLFLSGLRDELIPPAQMKQLFAKAQVFSDTVVDPQPFRQFVEFPEGMHNNLPLMQGYFQSIKSFVDAVSKS